MISQARFRLGLEDYSYSKCQYLTEVCVYKRQLVEITVQCSICIYTELCRGLIGLIAMLRVLGVGECHLSTKLPRRLFFGDSL